MKVLVKCYRFLFHIQEYSTNFLIYSSIILPSQFKLSTIMILVFWISCVQNIYFFIQSHLFKILNQMTFSSTQLKNVGGKLLIIKQKSTHEKRLQQIYQRTPPHYVSTPQLKVKKTSSNKLTQHQNYEHHKNIEHLFNFISRKKTMADRLKDPHDFFAYPVYFFREEKPHKNKNRDLKKRKRKSSVHSFTNESEQSQFTRRYGIDVPTVKQLLSPLQKFTEQELRSFADSIAKIVYDFKLKTPEQLDFLKNCVLKTCQSHYPQEFQEIVQQIFEEVVDQSEREWK